MALLEQIQPRGQGLLPAADTRSIHSSIPTGPGSLMASLFGPDGEQQALQEQAANSTLNPARRDLKASAASFLSDFLFSTAQGLSAQATGGKNAGLAASLMGPQVRRTMIAEQEASSRAAAEKAEMDRMKFEQDMDLKAEEIERLKMENYNLRYPPPEMDWIDQFDADGNPIIDPATGRQIQMYGIIDQEALRLGQQQAPMITVRRQLENGEWYESREFDVPGLNVGPVQQPQRNIDPLSPEGIAAQRQLEQQRPRNIDPLSPEGIAARRQLEESASAGPVEWDTSPIPSPERTLWDAAQGRGVAGPMGTIAEQFSRTLGNVPGMPVAAQTLQDRAMFREAQNDLIRSLAVNRRFPVSEVTRLRQEMDIAPSAWDSPPALQQRLISLDRNLRRIMEAEVRVANSPETPAAQRQESIHTVEYVRRFLSIMGVPQDPAAAPNGGTGQVTPAAPRVGDVREHEGYEYRFDGSAWRRQ